MTSGTSTADQHRGGHLSPVFEAQPALHSTPSLSVHVEIQFTDPVIRSRYTRTYGSSPDFVPNPRICKGLLRRIERCSEELLTRKDSGALAMFKDGTFERKQLRYEIAFRISTREGGLVAERAYRSYQKQPLTVALTKDVIVATHRIVGLFLRRHDAGFRWVDAGVRDASVEGLQTFNPEEDGPVSLMCVPGEQFVESTQEFEFVPGYRVELSFRSWDRGRQAPLFMRELRVDSQQTAPLTLFMNEEMLRQGLHAINRRLEPEKQHFDAHLKSCQGGDCHHSDEESLNIDLRITNNLGPVFDGTHQTIRSNFALFRDHDACERFLQDTEAALVSIRDGVDEKIKGLHDFEFRVAELRGNGWSVRQPAVFQLDSSTSYGRRTIQAALDRIQTGVADVLRGFDAAIHIVGLKRGHLILDKAIVARAKRGIPKEIFSSPEDENTIFVSRLKARIQQDIDKVFQDTCCIDDIPEELQRPTTPCTAGGTEPSTPERLRSADHLPSVFESQPTSPVRSPPRPRVQRVFSLSSRRSAQNDMERPRTAGYVDSTATDLRSIYNALETRSSRAESVSSDVFNSPPRAGPRRFSLLPRRRSSHVSNASTLIEEFPGGFTDAGFHDNKSTHEVGSVGAPRPVEIVNILVGAPAPTLGKSGDALNSNGGALKTMTRGSAETDDLNNGTRMVPVAEVKRDGVVCGAELGAGAETKPRTSDPMDTPELLFEDAAEFVASGPSPSPDLAQIANLRPSSLFGPVPAPSLAPSDLASPGIELYSTAPSTPGLSWGAESSPRHSLNNISTTTRDSSLRNFDPDTPATDKQMGAAEIAKAPVVKVLDNNIAVAHPTAVELTPPIGSPESLQKAAATVQTKSVGLEDTAAENQSEPMASDTLQNITREAAAAPISAPGAYGALGADDTFGPASLWGVLGRGKPEAKVPASEPSASVSQAVGPAHLWGILSGQQKLPVPSESVQRGVATEQSVQAAEEPAEVAEEVAKEELQADAGEVPEQVTEKAFVESLAEPIQEKSFAEAVKEEPSAETVQEEVAPEVPVATEEPAKVPEEAQEESQPEAKEEPEKVSEKTIVESLPEPTQEKTFAEAVKEELSTEASQEESTPKVDSHGPGSLWGLLRNDETPEAATQSDNDGFEVVTDDSTENGTAEAAPEPESAEKADEAVLESAEAVVPERVDQKEPATEAPAEKADETPVEAPEAIVPESVDQKEPETESAAETTEHEVRDTSAEAEVAEPVVLATVASREAESGLPAETAEPTEKISVIFPKMEDKTKIEERKRPASTLAADAGPPSKRQALKEDVAEPVVTDAVAQKETQSELPAETAKSAEKEDAVDAEPVVLNVATQKEAEPELPSETAEPKEDSEEVIADVTETVEESPSGTAPDSTSAEVGSAESTQDLKVNGTDGSDAAPVVAAAEPEEAPAALPETGATDSTPEELPTAEVPETTKVEDAAAEADKNPTFDAVSDVQPAEPIALPLVASEGVPAAPVENANDQDAVLADPVALAAEGTSEIPICDAKDIAPAEENTAAVEPVSAAEPTVSAVEDAAEPASDAKDDELSETSTAVGVEEKEEHDTQVSEPDAKAAVAVEEAAPEDNNAAPVSETKEPEAVASVVAEEDVAAPATESKEPEAQASEIETSASEAVESVAPEENTATVAAQPEEPKEPEVQALETKDKSFATVAAEPAADSEPPSAPVEVPDIRREIEVEVPKEAPMEDTNPTPEVYNDAAELEAEPEPKTEDLKPEVSNDKAPVAPDTPVQDVAVAEPEQLPITDEAAPPAAAGETSEPVPPKTDETSEPTLAKAPEILPTLKPLSLTAAVDASPRSSTSTLPNSAFTHPNVSRNSVDTAYSIPTDKQQSQEVPEPSSPGRQTACFLGLQEHHACEVGLRGALGDTHGRRLSLPLQNLPLDPVTTKENVTSGSAVAVAEAKALATAAEVVEKQAKVAETEKKEGRKEDEEDKKEEEKPPAFLPRALLMLAGVFAVGGWLKGRAK